jgi:hypothetical protein
MVNARKMAQPGLRFHAFQFEAFSRSGRGLEHLQRCSVCDPAKIFFTSKLSYVPFWNPHP